MVILSVVLSSGQCINRVMRLVVLGRGGGIKKCKRSGYTVLYEYK